ncbi:MAG: preprotein translocase subunit YajC [Bacteroidetes bacterium]|jgi:preprotein translocase subunit YajC|nr:preprotein translocase subunit YajC [Bacteroidota bacterium]MBU1578894.1 preprotein translocase subunit YajC [Bacteroidota bacterium]MBU2464850.1 preprotein translocase subunit YajC [Bacteroidota bacterium]MBU2559057.1 preprotein translocase subunit YajC [Bacteroidota bacterium]MDA3944610.1 preprotein translocase subunit YajC [Bacteroidota bacterium]
MNILSILLLGGTAEGQESGGLMSFLPLVLIMVVFYFFFIRPQMKKAKDQRKYREALKKGDKIITIGGIHGKIIEVRDATFMVEVEGQNRLEIEKSAVVMDSSQIGQGK